MAKDMEPEYYRHVIERIYKEVLPYQGKGKVADYIPALAKVDPRQFGIAVEMSSGEVVTQGDANVCFSIQSRVSVEELSAYLEMPAEEIRDILKMAGDELKVEGYENC